MSGWHPEASDGGLLPSADPHNPAQAFDPAPLPIGTAPLYYGNGCDVRLRPHVPNSLISENNAVLTRVGLAYNPSRLDNLREAIEYLIQRGNPKFTVVAAQGTPTNYYRGTLDPPLLHVHNDGQALVVVPNESNQGLVRVDLGAGWIPVLRNDRAELEAADWPAWVPQAVAYFRGAFYMLGLAASQVPIVLKGTIGFWVRPDGNDQSGDGTANAPDKAFRTLQGAWSAVGSRFAASPTSHIAFRLGVTGDYEGAILGPYGATVSVTGDGGNPAAYRIHSLPTGGGMSCLYINSVNQCFLTGVRCQMDRPERTAYGSFGISCLRSAVVVDNVDIELTVNHPFSSEMLVVNQSEFNDAAGWIGEPSSTLRFIGNGNSVATIIWVVANSNVSDHARDFFTPPVWSFQNINARTAGLAVQGFSGVWSGGCRQWLQSGCTGKRYIVNNTSNLTLSGIVPPGDQPGEFGGFSTVTP